MATLLLVAASSAGPDDARRKQVERSLRPPVMPQDSSGYRLDKRLEALDAPGISVAVIEGLEIDWARAYGLADVDSGRALKPTTRHNVGSVSKTVCALTAMRLVEAGKLSLDRPINEYLETWKIPDNELTAVQPVTLRMLLSHSAGTTVHGFPGYRPDAELPSIVQVLDGQDPANTDPVRVDRLPGEAFRYSGGGTTIVQLAISDVTGKPFREVARELVFEPLGMEHTTYVQPVEGVEIGERARGVSDEPEFAGTEVFVAEGAAGMWSTPSDLARLLIALMRAWRGEEDTIVSQQTAREMLSPVVDEVGLGFFLDEQDGKLTFTHGGANSGFHAEVWAVPETGQGAVTLVNSDHGRELQREVLAAISDVYDWPGDIWESERVATAKFDRKTADAVAGRYAYGADDVITIAREGKRLTYRECYWGSRVIELLPLADGSYRLTSGNHSFGGFPSFTFERDADGAVSAMRLGRSAYVMPRMAKGTTRALESIEAGDVEGAIARWDRRADLDPGLMRFTAQQFDMRFDAYRTDGVTIREYVAKRFPLDASIQEMLADAYAVVGQRDRAQQVRDRSRKRSAALDEVNAKLEAGEVEQALAAFDELAETTGSTDAYQWLVGASLARLDEDPAGAQALAEHAARHLPRSANALAARARTMWVNGERDEAIETMERAIAANPAIEPATIERRWVRDRWVGESTKVDKKKMALYAGDYGPRHIEIDDGQLAYRRGSSPPRELVPVGPNEFMMRELDFFRLEFAMDEDGTPSAIVGHYSSGRRDETPRD